MQIGEVIKLKDGHYYVVVNYQGTLEKLPEIKWYAHLYLEIRQGLNKLMSLNELRKFIEKNKRFKYDTEK
jgi:hypothetical protein